MQSYLASNDDDEGEEGENGGMVPLGNGFYLFKDLMKNLYAHQKEGVLWMWGLHQKRKGGILGDDMGSVIKINMNKMCQEIRLMLCTV